MYGYSMETHCFRGNVSSFKRQHDNDVNVKIIYFAFVINCSLMSMDMFSLCSCVTVFMISFLLNVPTAGM